MAMHIGLRLRHFLKRIEVSRAVFFALLGKCWGLIASPVSLVMISLFLTAGAQGYYYTILSLLALQTFLELAFSTVLVNFMSHEWGLLHINERGEVAGDAQSLSRLAHLLRFSVKWYLVLALLFEVLVGGGGYFFLRHKHEVTVLWQGPWFLMVFLVGLQLALIPFQSTLEGCNQIGQMALIRMTASIIGSIAFWTALALRWELWAVCMTYGLNLVTQVVLLWHRYGAFFESLARTRSPIHISWIHEIFPMQWRLALGGVGNYFSTSLFTPVMFWYYGAQTAGQMGIGLQVMAAVQAIALTWIQVNIPSFGALISQKKFATLDRLFFRVTSISWGILLLSCVGAWTIVKSLFVFHSRFAERFMPPKPLALFLLAALFFHLPQCQAVYLRAHKQEPLLVVNIISSLAIGGMVWWFGKMFGLTGAGSAYLTVIAFFILPSVFFLWMARRKDWHVA
jgi:O-antigen/teichoic acid export membrane protein